MWYKFHDVCLYRLKDISIQSGRKSFFHEDAPIAYKTLEKLHNFYIEYHIEVSHVSINPNYPILWRSHIVRYNNDHVCCMKVCKTPPICTTASMIDLNY